MTLTLGVNTHAQYVPVPTLLSTLLPQLIASKGKVVRIDVNWKDLQPTARGPLNPVYLQRLDVFVSVAAAMGAKPMINLGYSPAWATSGPNGEDNALPLNAGDYIAVATALIKRWPALYAFEVWNEPDQGYSVDPNSGTVAVRAAAYAALLKAVYPALKAANPALIVLGPVLGYTTWNGQTPNGTTWDWLMGFFAASPQGYYDRISLHLYGDPPAHAATNGPAGTVFDGATTVSWFKSYVSPTILAADPTTPWWITEVGWTTAAGGVDEPTQAAYLTETVVAVKSLLPQVEVLCWYQLAAVTGDSSADYSMYRADGTAKPSLAAFQAFQALS